MRSVTQTIPDTAPIGHLVPGVIGPPRAVPTSIPRPEYVGKPGPAPFTGSEIKTADEIERMRIACRIAAQALAEVGKAVQPGVTTDELDRIGHEFLCDHRAYPSTLGYRGFPKSLCSSVNEVVCHGIPDSTVLAEGDLCNIDITAYIHGMHGDNNATFFAGEPDPQSAYLVEHAHAAMMRGIKAAVPGRSVNVIGKVIQSYARRKGLDTVHEFTGHGVGQSFHSGLVIPHYDSAPHYDDVIAPGMTFTVEPMITLGTRQFDMWDDGWTAVTRDRKRTAQFEHTILITESGPEILTVVE
ncbi:MAG: type I methionyl aminopeptidase [Actinomycetales bacterium]